MLKGRISHRPRVNVRWEAIADRAALRNRTNKAQARKLTKIKQAMRQIGLRSALGIPF